MNSSLVFGWPATSDPRPLRPQLRVSPTGKTTPVVNRHPPLKNRPSNPLCRENSALAPWPTPPRHAPPSAPGTLDRPRPPAESERTFDNQGATSHEVAPQDVRSRTARVDWASPTTGPDPRTRPTLRVRRRSLPHESSSCPLCRRSSPTLRSSASIRRYWPHCSTPFARP